MSNTSSLSASLRAPAPRSSPAEAVRSTPTTKQPHNDAGETDGQNLILSPTGCVPTVPDVTAVTRNAFRSLRIVAAICDTGFCPNAPGVPAGLVTVLIRVGP